MYNQLRSFFYIGQIAAENETFQKLGFISVSYQVGNYPKQGYDFELTRKVSTLVRGSAIRFVAIYVCYSYSPWKSVADLISHLVEPLLRVRLRSVTGTCTACMLTLVLIRGVFLLTCLHIYLLPARLSSRMPLQIADVRDPTPLFPNHKRWWVPFKQSLEMAGRTAKNRTWVTQYRRTGS